MEKYLYQDLYILEDTHWWHKAKRNIVSQLLKSYVVNKGKPLKILDIGCGAGKNLESLSRFGETFGIDNSPEAIKFCKKRKLANQVYLRNSDNTKFPNNYFDIVVLLDVLEHVDEKPTLVEINRILKPNGLLILTVPAFSWLWSQWDVVLHHKRRYNASQLLISLTQNNFKPLKTTYLHSFLIPPIIIIRSIKSKLKASKEYSSDFQINSSLINTILFLLSRIEAMIINFFSIPFGTSIVSLSIKKS